MLNDKHSRRSFLKNAGLTAAGTMLVPGFVQGANFGVKNLNGKRLVVIQLSGGNDGLNTVVPYRNDDYFRARNNLAHNANDVLKMTDEIGLHPIMTGLKNVYDNGDLCVINNVGYPNPNKSHFRAMDIWHSASGRNEYIETGWLGRYLDTECSSCEGHSAIQVDNLLDRALKGETKKGLPVLNPYQLHQSAEGVKLSGQKASSNSSADFLYKTMIDTKNSAAYVYEQSKLYRSKKTYPNTKLGHGLKSVAQFINSGMDTSIYYTSLSGFDTHFQQASRQQRLLGIYSEAVDIFIQDLKDNDNWKDTLILTFSEFGRRVKENGSRGTDHGKANNVFLMGGSLKKQGVYNEVPDLVDLDNGDLKHDVDFRQVYSTILDRWLSADADGILNKNFSRLDFI